MDKYVPPYDITDEMLELVSEITEDLGKLSSMNDLERLPRLRRVNRIRYSKSRFYSLFHEYGSAGARFHVKKSKNIGDILGFALLQSRYSNDAASFELVEKQMDDWCKERRLDKYKIWDLRVAGF